MSKKSRFLQAHSVDHQLFCKGSSFNSQTTLNPHCSVQGWWKKIPCLNTLSEALMQSRVHHLMWVEIKYLVSNFKMDVDRLLLLLVIIKFPVPPIIYSTFKRTSRLLGSMVSKTSTIGSQTLASLFLTLQNSCDPPNELEIGHYELGH